MLAHAGRRTQDSTVHRGRPSVPALDLAGHPALLRYVLLFFQGSGSGRCDAVQLDAGLIFLCFRPSPRASSKGPPVKQEVCLCAVHRRSVRHISEGMERQMWSPMDHAGPWGAALPQSQPMPVPPAPYYTPMHPGGFGNGPLSGGYSPFQAVAHRPLVPPVCGPEWAAQDLPKPPQHDDPSQQLLQSYDHHARPQQQDEHWNMHGYIAQDLLGDRTSWNLEAAAQPPGGYGACGSEWRPPVFSAVGRVPLSGFALGPGGIPSPEGGFRPRAPPPAAPDMPVRSRALTSAHSDAAAHFQAAAAAAAAEPAFGEAPPQFARVHPAHAAVLRGAGLRHAGSAPCELPAFGQPAAAGADGLLWDGEPAEWQRNTSLEVLPRESSFPERQRGAAAAAGGGWDSGPSVASAPAATTLSRAGSSRGSSPAISPSNNPGTLLRTLYPNLQLNC